MHLVAITRLASSIDVEAKALAGDLGALPYDQRLKLARGIPAIVLTTPDAARAADLAERIRARGHGALAFSTADVPGAETMTPMRKFAFDQGGVVAAETGARLAWSDIAVLVRGVHRVVVTHSEVVTTSKFSPTRALVTGGLVMNKVIAKQVTTHAEDVESVLYVFPRAISAPWLLREQHASYATLGDLATAASMHNFETTIDRMRTLARGAVYDDRLVARRGFPSEVDQLAYVVAASALAASAAPFR